MPSDDVFPTLVGCANLFDMKDKRESLFDVQFYPYPTEDGDQIFAAAGEKDTIICRMIDNSHRPFEIVRWYRDEETTTSINSLAWTKDPVTREPLLCLAGSVPTQIKILDIQTGKPVRTLSGHGKPINDLAVSPLSTNIIASASEDYTIRLWNLDAKHEKQPCVAIFGGEGHRQPILAINFHPNGQWLLSGGLDTAVCLWSVPQLSQLTGEDERHQNGDQPEGQDILPHKDPRIVYYPYFHSTEVHHNYVDSVHFYGDLILSKAARDPSHLSKKNEILLWKIEGFNPDAAAPEQPPLPAEGIYTRSSFPHPARSSGFQRLVSFRIDQTDRFYHRAGLLYAPGMRPILCMGTQESRFCFWDLQGLEEGRTYAEEKTTKSRARGRKTKASVSTENLTRSDSLRGQSVTSESTGAGRTTPQASSTSAMDRKNDLSDPFRQLPPHNVQTAGTNFTTFVNARSKKKDNRHFATSQLAWSPNGQWLVGVGDYGMVCVFHRDASVLNR